MSDPPRLRDLAGGDDFTRGLLRDASATRPFTAADAARLQGSVTKVGASGTGGWFASGAVQKGLAALAIVVAGGGAMLATRRPPPAAQSDRALVRQSPAAQSTPPVAVTSPTVAAPAVAVPVAVAAPVVIAAPVALAAPTPVVARPIPAPQVASAVVAPSRPALARPQVDGPVALGASPVSAAVAAPTLNDELRAIEEAQSALASDPARAAAVLARAERINPRPQLRDERDVLHIEALTRIGRWSEARARAAALEARAPQSPQSARARSLLRAAP